MHNYNLRIGNIVVTIRLRREREKAAFVEYFKRPSHQREGDIALSLRFEDKAKPNVEVPSSLFLTKVGDGSGFSVAEGLIKGRYSPESGEGELIVQSAIMQGYNIRVFEQILYQAYWSAVRRKGLDSLLMHSSCMERNGKGYVFTGKSGSGKSTVASLSADAKIFNDEISVIDLGGRPVEIFDAPFNGFFEKKIEGSAPLAGVYILVQAPRHRVSRTTSSESIKTLSREIIPPMGLETPFSQKVYWEMLDYATRIAEAVPLNTLEFLPDPGFWGYIEKARDEG